MKIKKADAVAVFIALGFNRKVVEAWSDDKLAEKCNKINVMYDKSKKISDAAVMKTIKTMLAAVKEEDDIELDLGKAKGKAAAPAAKGKAAKGKKAAADDDDDEEEEDSEEEEEEESDDDEEDDSDDDSEEEEEEESDDEDDSEEDEDDSDDEEDGDEDSEEEESDDEDEDDSEEDEEESDDEDDEDPDTDDDEEDEPVTKTKKKGKPGAATSAGGNGKPGIIATIIEVLEKATEDKPVTKEKIHAVLVKRFKDRDPDSMMTTVGVQVPSHLRMTKQLNVQRSGKGYYIAKGKLKAKAPKDDEDDAPAKKKGKKVAPPAAKAKKKGKK